MKRVLLVATTALALTACAPPTVPAAASTALASSAIPPYERSAFGDGWASTGRGCDTRDIILRRDVTAVTNADRCGPLAGTLRDPYSGVVVVGPTRQLDIDHRVPLEYAWEHGAWRWSDAQRIRFANDPDELVMTTANQNRSKGSRGLGEWTPKVDPCDYGRTFDAIADRYGLEGPARDSEVARACR